MDYEKFQNLIYYLNNNKDNKNAIDILKLLISDWDENPDCRLSSIISLLSENSLDGYQKGILSDLISEYQDNFNPKKNFFAFDNIHFEDEKLCNDFKKNPNIYVLDCLNQIYNYYSVISFKTNFESLKCKIEELNIKIKKANDANKFHKSSKLLDEQKKVQDELESHRLGTSLISKTHYKYQNLYFQLIYHYCSKFETLCQLKLVFNLLLDKSSYQKLFKHYFHIIYRLKSNWKRDLDSGKYLVNKDYDQEVLDHLENISRIICYKNKDKITLEEYISDNEITKIFSKKDENFVIEDKDYINFYNQIIKDIEKKLDKEIKILITTFNPNPTKCYLAGLIDEKNVISYLNHFIRNRIEYWINPEKEFFFLPIPDEIKGDIAKIWTEVFTKPTQSSNENNNIVF